MDLLKNEILHQLSVGNMELRRTKNPLFFTEGFNVLIIIQQIFIKNWLYATNGYKCLGYSREQDRQKSLPCRAYILAGLDK